MNPSDPLAGSVTDDLPPCPRCGELGHECTRADALIDELRDRQAGINALERWILAHPEVVEHPGVSIQVNDAGLIASPGYLCADADRAEVVRMLVRAVADRAAPGDVRKKHFGGTVFVEREFATDVGVQVQVAQADVCEWVVTGTETVEVPDPAAPKITETRDVGEWRCSPLLAEVAP